MLLETAEVFRSDDVLLRGMLHWPVEAPVDKGLVVCYPFGEERKSSARVMTLTARRFCFHGYHVLRFDRFGTGESDGCPEQATIRQWLRDIHAARQHMLARVHLSNVGLLGLRFGATLATLYEADMLPWLVLWGPQISGSDCLAQCRRHQSVRRILTDAPLDADARLSYLREDQAAEMGGFRLSEQLRVQMESLQLPDAARARAAGSVIVQFTCRRKIDREHEDLVARLTPSGNSHSWTLAVRPFWVTAMRHDPAKLVDQTVAALRALHLPQGWEGDPAS